MPIKAEKAPACLIRLGRLSTKRTIPLWIKIVYTLFVAIFVLVYYQAYGISNFLWFSDLAVIITCIAVWLESSLLSSMMALSIILFELLWCFDFFIRLVTGWYPLNLTLYMFDPSSPLLVRGISLFHVFLPILLLWLLYRLGYNRKALLWQTLFAWTVILICFFFTPMDSNINLVFRLRLIPQTLIYPKLYLIIGMLIVPVVIYLPSHLIFRKLFRAKTR